MKIRRSRFSSIFIPVLFLHSLFITSSEARGFPKIPGAFCSGRSPTCCPSRNDECTAPIFGNHLCYCDMFCDRGENGNDCCPDFEATCKGSTSVMQNDMAGRECEVNGRHYEDNDVVRINCATCACVNAHWKCSEDICLIQPDLLEGVQSGRFSWTARNYSKFWGKTLEEGIKYRLGTLLPERSVQNMNEIVVKPREEIPDYFDSREKWPGLIHPVRDQGDCGSSWAVSTTSTSSDRLAIISEGKINTSMSPQQLLSCNQHRQKGCEGGYLDRAWWYIRKLGVVQEECYPYSSGGSQEPGTCLIPRSIHKTGERLECPSGNEDTTILKLRLWMTPPYRVGSREEDIQTEILTNGPVQGTFAVHEDFFMYGGGVYQHQELAANKGMRFTGQGYHSVRVLGWGEDLSTGRPLKYWLCANSWGEDWGEGGLFRILRGENHCDIESFVIGAWGRSGRRRRRFKVRKARRRIRRF